MTVTLRPQLRPLELVTVGGKDELVIVFRDPEFYCESVAVPPGAAMLMALMDGKRTLAEIQSAFRRQFGASVSLTDLQELVRRLDESDLLAGQRFEQRRCRSIDEYRGSLVRPALHAGKSYAADPDELRRELGAMFTDPKGPGQPDSCAQPDVQPVCGIISPHIDLKRGGPAFAWAYKKLAEESNADLLVIFGTAHHPMSQPFCIARKDFATPLGVVQTDREFIDRLQERLGADEAGHKLDLEADDLVQRHEHSIEFQAVFLQYLLGPKRPFRIVPVLVGSLQGFLDSGIHPDESPEVQSFLRAVKATADDHYTVGRTSKSVPGTSSSIPNSSSRSRVSYIAGADLAHIGQQFGDERSVDDAWLAEVSDDDQALLAAACRGDSAGFYDQVAAQHDRHRICGLAPIYALLKVLQPARGRLLTYQQAVDPDRTSCVSFASVALWKEGAAGSSQGGTP